MTTAEPVPNLNLEREEAAYRELGETHVAPGVARAVVFVFVLTLTLVPALEIPFRKASGPGVGTAFRELLAWPLDDCEIQGVESRIEERSHVAQQIRPRVQAALTGIFRLGSEQVYLGRDGWLFQRAGFDHLTGPPFLRPSVQERRVRDADPCKRAPAPDPIAAIGRFHDDLAARQVELVVIPTPVKGVLEGEQMEGKRGAIVRNPSFEPFVDTLTERGVAVFDPAPFLQGWQERTGAEAIYLATDTHWQPEAMGAVAEALAEFLEERFELGPQTPGRERRALNVVNRGDLAGLLDLPPGETRMPLESVTIQEVRAADGSLWSPTRGAAILLLGDSFSNIYSVRAAFAQSEDGEPLDWGEAAGLAEQLSFHLARPVDRIARNAGGAHATRRDLVREIADDSDPLDGVRVVVWQFAVRELSQGDWQVLPLPPRQRE
ncbi:MAG: hypothetical protein GY723_13100 [bacterium]|nr:hypothetical protein [bacterium]MCP5065640.1 hypothetical protein [bacterium]